MRHPLPACTLALALACCLAGAAEPQAPAPQPDTATLIEALTPRAQRGLRNLQVRQRVDEAAAGAGAPAAGASAAAAAAATASAAAASTEAAAATGAASSGPSGAPSSPASSTASSTSTAEPRPSIALSIPFEINSARLRPESGPLLGNLVAAMQSPALKGSRFVIEGHTDASGGAALNQRLSQERADEVRLYLVALGVHPARLRAVGRGASEPANPLAPDAAENRRVRVVTVE